MGYVKSTLAAEEDYLYRAKFNWTYDAISWMWFAIGSTPAAIWAFELFRQYLQIDMVSEFFTFAAGSLFALSALFLLYRYIHRWTTVLAVTSERLILKRGWIARDTREVNLDNIEEVVLHQSVLGRIFGFGSITVRGTGVAIIEFPVLARPTEIRREIESAIIGVKSSHK